MITEELWDKLREKVPELKEIVKSCINEHESLDEIERHSSWYKLYLALVDFEDMEF